MFHPKSKLFIAIFKIILISSYFRSCLLFKPFIPKTSKSPEIWLASFQHTDSFDDDLADPQFRHRSEFENEFVSKINTSDYIIQDDTRKVVFICQAKYPVMWTTPHYKQVENLPLEMFTTDTVRKADILDQIPKNKYFRTSLTIRFDGYIRDVFSVNFTCGLPNANQEQRKKFPEYTSSSIHIYYAESQQVIEHFDDTIPINIPKNYVHDTFIIPCRPALPTVSVQIEKEVLSPQTSVTNDEQKRKWEEIHNFAYDPKYGFTVETNIKESIFGMYRCCISDQGDSCDETKVEQVVLVNVTLDSTKTPKPTIEDIKFEPSLNLKGNALIMYGDHIFGRNTTSRNFPTSSYRESGIWCCSGVNNDRPLIYKRVCTNPLQCEILKRLMANSVMTNDESGNNYVNYGHSSMDPEDCESTLFYDENSVVFCKGENVQFGDFFVKLFSEGLLPISERKNRAKQSDIWTFERESIKAAANISRRMFMTVVHSMGTGIEDRYSGKFIEFFRSNEPQYNEITLDYYDDEEKNFKTAFISFPKKKQTQFVAEYSRDIYYVGESLIPVCLGWLSFYSHGAYLKVLMANGTSAMLNVNEAEVPFKYVMHLSEGLGTNIYYHSGNLMEYKFGKEVVAQKDMVAFECWMPQWNSEKWDKLKFELTILEPTKPEFLEWSNDVNETSVYFDLGKVNQTLEWRIFEGSPKPKIDVTIDGKNIYSGYYTNGDKLNPSYYIFDKFNLSIESDGVNDSTEIVSVKLLFIQVTHEVQGVYQCQATNVGGKVTHGFTVVATEKRSITWVLILVLTISIMSVLIFTGLVFKFWKQKTIDEK